MASPRLRLADDVAARARCPRCRRRRGDCSRPAAGRSGYSEGTGDRTKGKELFVAEVRQLPHARGRGHERPDRPEPRLRVPRVARERARREHDRPGRPGADRVPDHGPVDRSARDAGEPRQGPGRGGRGELRGERRRDRRPDTPRTPHRPTPTTTAPTPTTTEAAGAAETQPPASGVHDGRLRRLPHARGRRRDGQRRPEPRRGEARRRARDERVTNGKGVMPPSRDSSTRTQIADVAAYVSSVAGK